MSPILYQLRIRLENIISYLFENERPALAAWAISLSILTVLSLIPNERINYYPDLIGIIWGALTTGLGLAYLFFTIRFFRGKSKQSSKQPYIKISLNWWGYLWRGLIVLWLLQFLLIPLMLITKYMNLESGSPVLAIAYVVLSIIFTPILSFILFAVDRKEKLTALASFLRSKC
ncbi:MAG: hypothetical protein D3922_08280 [Candidatus Electrothrix sp. AR1]|nr:hypothetical protein [Candidatus Electrothrix sp. AR1]